MVMLPLTASLLATFQAAFAQDAHANSNSSATLAGPSAVGNWTGDASSALANAASKAASAVANTTGSAINATQSLVSNLTTPVVDEASCGSASQHINACLEHVHKDVSSCHQNDDACLCQTYANLASCYNGCPSLAAQGEQYKSQSAQHCSMPGVAEKIKAAAEKNSTSTTTVTHHNTTSDSSNGQPKMSAKSAAFGRLEVSSVGLSSSIFAFALTVILA